MKNTGSLFYQMIHAPKLMQRANGHSISFQTQEDYFTTLHYAAVYFTERNIRNLDEIGISQIQDYADYLLQEGKSASTIHNYLAPLCKVAQVSMADIQKPRRFTSEYTRSRTKEDRYEGVPLTEFPPSVLLSKCTGLRRDELKRVKGRDLIQEDGTTYVLAEKGKGGKTQIQKILPHYVPYLEELFRNVSPDQKVLQSLLYNYDYHLARRRLAQECYAHYVARCTAGEAERKKLYREIADYWHKNNKRDRDKLEPYSYFERPYFLRGKTKAAAIAQNKPAALDRLCLRAASVFHLAHWRDNVTTQSYYLD